MKLIKKIASSSIHWLTKDIDNTTTNPTSEFEYQLITQRCRYENNYSLLQIFIEQDRLKSETLYCKYRKLSKNKSITQFFLKSLSLLLVVIITTSILINSDDLYLLIIAPTTIYALLVLYWLNLYLIQPQMHEKSHEEHLLFLSTISRLTTEAIYKNLDGKNPANFRPIFKSKLPQIDICTFFITNFELIQREKKKYYYKPFIDFASNNIVDKDENRFNPKSFQSAFSRALEKKIE